MELSVVAYNAAISACEIGDHWQIALALLDDMLLQNLPPTLVKFNVLLSACGKGGRWKLILDIVDRMGKAKMDPDAILLSHTTLPFAFFRDG